MKTLLLIIYLSVPALAIAKPADVKKYKDAFPDKAAQANCKTCHTSGKALNDFGKAYAVAGSDFSKLK